MGLERARSEPDGTGSGALGCRCPNLPTDAGRAVA